MNFDNRELDCSFVIPDDLTMRDLLKYDSSLVESGWLDASMYERWWEAAKTIVKDWKCDVPLDTDVGLPIEARSLAIVKWVGLQAFSFVRSLENVPKNSSGQLSPASTETEARLRS